MGEHKEPFTMGELAKHLNMLLENGADPMAIVTANGLECVNVLYCETRSGPAMPRITELKISTVEHAKLPTIVIGNKIDTVNM